MGEEGKCGKERGRRRRRGREEERGEWEKRIREWGMKTRRIELEKLKKRT